MSLLPGGQMGKMEKVVPATPQAIPDATLPKAVSEARSRPRSYSSKQ